MPILSPPKSISLNFCLLNCLFKSVLTLKLVGSKLKLKSLTIFQYLLLKIESLFLKGAIGFGLKLKA